MMFDLSKLEVAILCGGLGTRVQPETDNTPKAMLPVGEHPFIAWQLYQLQQCGIRRAVLCIGHLGKQIRDFVGTGKQFGIAVQYADDGAEPAGTAGALLRARPLLGENFFVQYGDSYLPSLDYADVYRTFLLAGLPALLTLGNNNGSESASNAVLADGLVVHYGAHQNARHVDYGLSVLSQPLLDTIPYDLAVSLTSLYGGLAAGGKLAGYAVEYPYYEIGSPAGLAQMRELVAPAGRRRPAR